MADYGLFNDEGCFYGPCYSVEEAEAEVERYVAEGEDREDIEIKEMCQEHPGEAKDDCPSCWASYDE